MKCNVLKTVKLKTSQGKLELQQGQVVALHNDIAIRLINEGRIVPIGKVTYKIYSKILDDYLWIAATKEELQELVNEGTDDVIYSQGEILRMIDEGVPKEGLKAIHRVKKFFPGSSVEDISDENRN